MHSDCKRRGLPCHAWPHRKALGWVRRQRETRILGQEALLFSAARNKKELQGKQV